MNEADNNSGNGKTQSINDNRKYPRVEKDGNVVLVISSNELLNTTLQDISQDGMQVRLDNDTALALKPVIDLISDNTINEIEVRFVLSMQGQEEQIVANCKPIYIMKIEQGLFGMGMQFTGIDEKHNNYIQQFIENSMEPL
jgi:c-di-GMP-binding flagellar brake protein YcgR